MITFLVLDIGLCTEFIRGKYAPDEVKQTYTFKKLRAQLRKPLTCKIFLNHEPPADVRQCVKKSKLKREIEALPDAELIALTDMQPCIPITHVTMDKYIKLGEFPSPVKKIGRSHYHSRRTSAKSKNTKSL